jgi:flagellar biosynthesis GTPase FlhF
LETDEELPNYDEVTRGRVIDRSEEKMKSDLEESEKRQRLLAEDEKSSMENIERETKKERESVEIVGQSAILDHRKEAEVVQEKRKKWEMEKKQYTRTLEKIVTLNVGGTKYTHNRHYYFGHVGLYQLEFGL